MMGRPWDWVEVLGFQDPTPGEVHDIRSLARRWSDVADEAEFAEVRLRGLLGDGAVTTWIGQAGEAFRSQASDLPEQLGKTKRSYRQACEALSWWARRLELHQADADTALVRGRVAKADLASALHQVGVTGGQVDAASSASVLDPTSAQTAVVAPTRGQVSAAMSKLASARAAAAHAQALADDAQVRLNAARQLAAEAGQLRVADGRMAAERIHEAAEAGVAPRSFWAKTGHALASAWHVVVAVAKVVVAVLGVVALIIGGPLAWVVFAAALIVLADTLMKYSKGQASLLEVGLALLSCVPGTKGLTTLGELAAAAKAGGMLGAGVHLLGAGKVAIAGVAESVRTLSGSLKTVLVRIGKDGTARARYVVALARGFRSMVNSEFGVLGSMHSLPRLLRIRMPREGDEVYRIFGSQLDGVGNIMHQEGDASWKFGSGPNGASWSPIDPSTVRDFRSAAGLPDENPARFLRTGALGDVGAVELIRLGLPLDGQPGGIPELLIREAGISVRTTGISGVNEGYTMAPGTWRGPS